jgi:hypothetical protein
MFTDFIFTPDAGSPPTEITDGYGLAIPAVVAGAPAGIEMLPALGVVTVVGCTFKVVVLPKHILILAGEITGAAGVAFTVAEALAVQPVAVSVPVTV